MEHSLSLKVISKAWGRQRGYCFFPWIAGDAKDKKERILSYKEGPAFWWPRDKEKILEHMAAHVGDDLYWCPSLFEYPKRRVEFAMNEHALWADLDSVDPRGISDYPPTAAWETSPGRYQAIWLIVGGDMMGASWPGRENQKLTYHLGADTSGWDTTQLLRIPGWVNHKPEYRKKDRSGKVISMEGVQGKLLWKDKRQYLPDEWDELPEVENVSDYFADVLEDEIDHIDRFEVWGRVRLKVSKLCREYVSSRTATGNRSEILWQIERELADAGCSVTEIVAVIKPLVWNKYAGRSDELKRLSTEAAKAIQARSEEKSDAILEEIQDKADVTNLFELMKNLKPPIWLVRGILTEGAVGFIAGQPKSFKSWAGLDLALSVASGQPFLGHFPVEKPGPVLYIQEEDSGPLIKSRLGKIWPNMIGDKVTMEDWGDGNGPEVTWSPGIEEIGDMGNGVDIDGYINQSLVLSDEGWQAWLDETLSKKIASSETGRGYTLIVIDPLMMVAGDVEENRAQEMTTKIFKPLKTLARKYGIAIILVHHMKKANGNGVGGPVRGGQMLLGSVANHAWAEDSLYFTIGRKGSIVCEQESKNAPVYGFTITGLHNRRWTPQITIRPNDAGEGNPATQGSPGKRQGSRGYHRKGDHVSKTNKPISKALQALKDLGPGPHSVGTIADLAQISRQSVYARFKTLEQTGIVKKVGSQFSLTGED